MKYVLECTSYALSPPCWATQLRIGVPSLTHNPNLRYTYETAEHAENQRPLYEQALNVTLIVVPVPPARPLGEGTVFPVPAYMQIHRTPLSTHKIS
jgi:hypothetical protein